MHIENEAAGSVIGKGGQKVGEIRKISGAQVPPAKLALESYIDWYIVAKCPSTTIFSGAHFNRGGADVRRRENSHPNRNS